MPKPPHCARLSCMEMEERKAEVASFMRRIYDRGLTTATGGNLSLRVGSLMLITPSGKDKASLTGEDIAEVDISTGENLTPDKRLSIETEMHRLIYLRRPDVGAVAHSHPLFSCLFSASSEPLRSAIIAEDYYLLGDVPVVPYRQMGSKALAEAVAEHIVDHDALLLQNHGALAVGKDLLSSFDRLECLEQCAHLTFLSRIIDVDDINERDRAAIALMR